MLIHGDQCRSSLGIDIYVVDVAIFNYRAEQLLINLHFYEYIFQHIKTDLRMYTAVNYVTIALVWCQAIIKVKAGLFLIVPMETKNSAIWIKIKHFSYKEINFKTLSARWRPSYLGLNEFKHKRQLSNISARTVFTIPCTQ